MSITLLFVALWLSVRESSLFSSVQKGFHFYAEAIAVWAFSTSLWTAMVEQVAAAMNQPAPGQRPDDSKLLGRRLSMKLDVMRLSPPTLFNEARAVILNLSVLFLNPIVLREPQYVISNRVLLFEASFSSGFG